MNFALLNAFKYAWRYKYKNGYEDIQKGIWYIDWWWDNYHDRYPTDNPVGLEDEDRAKEIKNYLYHQEALVKAAKEYKKAKQKETEALCKKGKSEVLTQEEINDLLVALSSSELDGTDAVEELINEKSDQPVFMKYEFE